MNLKPEHSDLNSSVNSVFHSSFEAEAKTTKATHPQPTEMESASTSLKTVDSKVCNSSSSNSILNIPEEKKLILQLQLQNRKCFE